MEGMRLAASVVRRPGQGTTFVWHSGSERDVLRRAHRAGPRSLQHPLTAGGLATSAAQAGVAERAIINKTGHRSLPVMRGYIRGGTLFRDNAAAMVDL